MGVLIPSHLGSSPGQVLFAILYGRGNLVCSILERTANLI